MKQDDLKLVLEALKWCHGGEPCGTAEAIAVVEKALAQEQEPGLEGEEIRNLWEEATKPDRSTMTMVTSFARAIEAKLKEKNSA